MHDDAPIIEDYMEPDMEPELNTDWRTFVGAYLQQYPGDREIIESIDDVYRFTKRGAMTELYRWRVGRRLGYY